MTPPRAEGAVVMHVIHSGRNERERAIYAEAALT